jgi:hypothetical protein
MSLNLHQASKNTQKLIPDGTIARVRMSIKKGHYNNSNKGWTGGYAARNPKSGVVSLRCEAVVLEGEYAHQRVKYQIGLESPNNDLYQTMGQDLMLGILNSAHGLMPNDESPEAVKLRDACDFPDLDGLEFTALIQVKEGTPPYRDSNVINFAITPDDERYLPKSPSVKKSKGQTKESVLPEAS